MRTPSVRILVLLAGCAAGVGVHRHTGLPRRARLPPRRPRAVAPRSRRVAPVERPAVDLRRRERRSLLLVRRHAAVVPGGAEPGELRPDLHDERRRVGRPADQRRRPHDVLLLHAGPEAASSTRRRSRAGATCPPVPTFDQGYVWPIYDELRHLHRERRRVEHPAAHDDARLRRRGHDPQGRPHRLHERARRRHGDLLDERRRQRRAPADAPRRARRRAVLLARRASRSSSAGGRCRPGPNSTTTATLLKQGAVAADVARDLRDERRRLEPAAGDEPEGGELRAVLHARRQEDHLLVERRTTRRGATSSSS